MKGGIGISGIWQLAYRYIVSQKKRSVLTIIGIALPIMLVVIVGQTFASLKATELYEVEENIGAYHFFINTTTLKQGQQIVNLLEKNQGIGKCGISTALGVSILKDGRKISCVGLDQVATQLKSLVIKSGRFPQKNNEVCIEEWIIPSMNAKPELGKEFTLSITDSSGVKQNRNFILSGILKTTSYKTETQGYGALLCMKNQAVIDMMGNNNISSQVYGKFNYNGSSKDFEKKVMKLFGYHGQPAFSKVEMNINNEYFSALVNSNNNDNVQRLLIGIILFAAILMIYNILNITVSERIHQYGLLRCMGISGVQLFMTVLTEAFLLSIASIVSGLMMGYGMTFLVVKHLILRLQASKIVVQADGNIMGMATILGVITVLLSACIPAYRAYRMSPISASRTSGVEGKHSKRKSVLERVIGDHFSATVNLAVCNLKRYKGKRIVTLLSLIISATVFMLLLYFNSNYMQNSSKIQNSSIGDFSVWVNSQSQNKFNEDDRNKMRNIIGVKAIHGYNQGQNMMIAFKIDKTVEATNVTKFRAIPYIKAMNYFYPQNKSQARELKRGILQSPITIYGCDEFLLEHDKIILESGKIEVEKLKAGKSVLISVNDNILMTDKELDLLPIGKIIDILPEINQRGEVLGKAYSTKIGGRITGFPGAIEEEYKDVLVYVHKDVLDKITKTKEYVQLFIEAEKNADYAAVEKQIKQITATKIGVHYDNYVEQKKIMKDSLDKYSSVLFAMIFMVLIVSMVNVFNTMYSNILQRTNELGMIRAVGMSKKEMKRMFLLESLYYGVISSFMSVGITVVLSILIFSQDPHENTTSILKATPWIAYLFTGVGNTLLCVGVMSLSALRTFKMSVVEAIRVVE
jgi:putative ABC transport system permease protein